MAIPHKRPAAAEPAPAAAAQRKSSLLGIIRFAETMAVSLDSFYSALDSALYEDFRQIAEDIARMRGEIGQLQAHDLRARRLPEVDDALDAIRAEAREATETILHNAESILAADTRDPAAFVEEVNDRVISIIEACAFQDLTGQRIGRVIETMRHIEERVSRFANAVGMEEICAPLPVDESVREKRRSELLLHGPQRKDEAISQDDIDALLAGDD